MNSQDIINLLLDYKKRGATLEDLDELHKRLRKQSDGSPVEILADHATRIQRIFSGTETEERNLTQEVREWILSSSGTFFSNHIARDLCLKGRQPLRNLSNILGRLTAEKLIVKWGDVNGMYRRVDDDLEEIDLDENVDPETDSIPLEWPFYLATLYIAMPKNIIVVAGEADAGKTAFLFNFVRLNMDRHERNIFYYNNEMGMVELVSRLKKFKTPTVAEFKKKCRWFERSENYADAIAKNPDGIHIIDFLELTENFFLVAKHLKDIHNALGKGIAIVALQKNHERTFKDGSTSGSFGLGGEKGLAKPRLYLTMNKGNPHTCKIIKCKNWKHEDLNPNGMELKYKVAKGCNLIIDELWKRPDETDDYLEKTTKTRKPKTEQYPKA